MILVMNSQFAWFFNWFNEGLMEYPKVKMIFLVEKRFIQFWQINLDLGDKTSLGSVTGVYSEISRKKYPLTLGK